MKNDVEGLPPFFFFFLVEGELLSASNNLQILPRPVHGDMIKKAFFSLLLSFFSGLPAARASVWN